MAFSVNDEPPPEWLAQSQTYRDLFHSPQWQAVLQQGFACNSVYVCDDKKARLFTVVIFNISLFRIAYLGFPVGDSLTGEPLSERDIEQLKQQIPAHVLRIPVSYLNNTVFALPHVDTPETAIYDLVNWKLETVPGLRRYIRRAQRAQLHIRDLHQTSITGKQLFSLYEIMIMSHKGSLRYTENYFSALINLSKQQAQIRCLGSFKGEQLVGFMIVALQNQTGYYLHGATDPNYKNYGSSDLLMHEAITWAQQQGMQCFNFMSSPVQQPGLIRYKEKFGGQTGWHSTYELSISPFYSGLFKLALILNRLVEKIKAHFS